MSFIALPHSVIAQTSVETQQLDRLAEEYTIAYGIGIEEAKWRLRKLAEARELDRRFELAMPDAYAGMHHEREPEFRIEFRFTSTPAERLASATRDSTFRFALAPRTLERLYAAQEEIADAMKREGVLGMLEVEIRTSRISVVTPTPALARSRLAELLRRHDFVDVVVGDLPQLAGRV